VRHTCETIAATFALLADAKTELAVQKSKLKFEDGLRSLFRTLVESPALISALMKNADRVGSLFESVGMAIVHHSGVELAGLTPPSDVVADLATELKREFTSRHRTVIAVDSLKTLAPRFEALKEIACGVLAVYAPMSEDAIFMIFRPEVLRTITWGGDPRKTMLKRNYAGVINPRSSFESWNETVAGHSKPWSAFQINGAEFLRDFVFNSLVKKERLIEELGQKLDHHSKRK
jgi:chemotaxis family two-component system sensor kinase Cph1